MDGNRRWAKKRKMTSYKGHSAGYEKLKSFIGWSKEAGIGNLVVYAFSTENWNRKQSEINYLFKIFRKLIFEELNSLKNEGVRIKFIGQINRFPKDIQNGIKKLEAETQKNKSINVFVALSYGARAEIINAVNEIIKDKRQKVSENTFRKYLWTKDMPDPDLIIRTGGEVRLSNFLLWQSAYSELFFTKTFWPDFSKKKKKKILKEFQKREKRFGR